jgi:hypothetical protein
LSAGSAVGEYPTPADFAAAVRFFVVAACWSTINCAAMQGHPATLMTFQLSGFLDPEFIY